MTHALQYGSLAIDSSEHAVLRRRPARRSRGPRTGAATPAPSSSSGRRRCSTTSPPETIFDPATDGPKQDSFETMAWKFRGSDNLTARGRAQLRVPADRARPHGAAGAGAAVGADPARADVERLLQPVVDAALRGGAADLRGARDRPRRQRRPDAGRATSSTATTCSRPTRSSSRSRRCRRTAAPRSSASRASATSRPPQFMEYECRLDSRDPEVWLECTNPAMYSNLSTGLHTFEVRAIAGEFGAFEGDPTPARYTWRVGPDPDDPGGTPLTLRRGEHHPDRQRGRVGRPGQPARELHVPDRARGALGRDRSRQRPADRAAERARLLPLPDPERRARTASSSRRPCASTPAGTPRAGRSRPSRSRTPGRRARSPGSTSPTRIPGAVAGDDRVGRAATASGTSRRTSRRSGRARCRTTAG